MKFDTKSGYGFMHLYLTLHPKKSPAYDPTEEGYIFDEAESRLHHFAEFIRFNEKLAAEGNAIRPYQKSPAVRSAHGWLCHYRLHFLPTYDSLENRFVPQHYRQLRLTGCWIFLPSGIPPDV